MDPPRHSQLRAIIQRAFPPRSIANLEPRIRELSRQLLNQLIERGEMDRVEDFAVPLPMMVIAEMLGFPAPEWGAAQALERRDPEPWQHHRRHPRSGAGGERRVAYRQRADARLSPKSARGAAGGSAR